LFEVIGIPFFSAQTEVSEDNGFVFVGSRQAMKDGIEAIHGDIRPANDLSIGMEHST
jgi:hypothetical protein